jgi:hypothetical protein
VVLVLRAASPGEAEMLSSPLRGALLGDDMGSYVGDDVGEGAARAATGARQCDARTLGAGHARGWA